MTRAARSWYRALAGQTSSAPVVDGPGLRGGKQGDDWTYRRGWAVADTMAVGVLEDLEVVGVAHGGMDQAVSVKVDVTELSSFYSLLWVSHSMHGLWEFYIS